MSRVGRRQFIRIVGGTAFSYASLEAFSRSYAAAGATSPGVLLEAASFANRGGWILDSQFVDSMGGAYLLAHGLGTPVDNATTTATFTKPGRYRVLVRTKDWCPPPSADDWESPGRFKVLIDGKPLATTFGVEPEWGWQNGGWIDVQAGSAKVELEDLTGFEGRCDAIYFTQDADSIPPNETLELVRWKDHAAGRTGLPETEDEFDLVVVGGGIAGCAAAMAAESQGLRVALLQERPLLGGNASSEVRVHTLGIHGKGSEILKKLDTEHWQNGSDASFQDDDKRHQSLAATSVEVFLNHRACGLELEGDSIACVDARHNESGVISRFRAPVFIDCTGDGWIGHWAGAESRYGREAADDFDEGWEKHGELWSPETPDNKVMGASVMWNTARTDRRVAFPETPWAKPVAQDHNQTRGDWNWEYSDNDLDQVADAELIRDHMFRAIYGTFANAKQDPRNATLTLTWIAYVVGKRESRRLMGDYIYTMRDVTENRRFPDTVVEEKRAIDVHYQLKETGYNVDFRSEALFRQAGMYYLPYRCFYSKNVPNLLMAGRCFSCSHIGLGGPRVQNTTGQMGIATGYAAALCNKYGVSPREVGQSHLAELRSLVGYS